MPALTITARFPLGVFQGHQADRSPAPFPDSARLVSALIQAAGKGSTAIERGGDLRPAKAAVEALRWLESHAPHAVTLPESQSVQVGRRRTFAWRTEGTFEKWSDRKTERRVSPGQAVAGAFAWHWEGVPQEVVQAVEEICPDVSCLGEADSPVVLETGVAEPTHWLDESATMLRRPPSGVTIRTASQGRLEVLERAYDEERPARKPTPARDRASQTQEARGGRVPLAGLRDLIYSPRAAQEQDSAPWNTALLLEAPASIAATERVGWCVALHRMIVSRIGDEAPGSITGKYARGLTPPANRLAIQFLTSGMLRAAGHEGRHGAFVLMIPSSMNAEDRSQLADALVRPRLYRGALGEMTLSSPEPVSAIDFWEPVRDGWRRLWSPVPALVPESRRQKPHPDLGIWSLESAAKLSVAHVFRDAAAEHPGEHRYWGPVERMERAGVRVSEAQLVGDSNVGRYAHKVSGDLGVVQPYRATIDLGELGNDRALLALGQSRHLGGGLLIPVDTVLEDA